MCLILPTLNVLFVDIVPDFAGETSILCPNDVIQVWEERGERRSADAFYFWRVPRRKPAPLTGYLQCHAITTSLPFRSTWITQTWCQHCVQPLHSHNHRLSSQTSCLLTHFHCTITTWAAVCSPAARTTDTMTSSCTTAWIHSPSLSKLFLCAPTPGLFEQGEASERLGHRQLAVDFVVPRTHVDTVSHLLLLSDHCQDTGRQTAWGRVTQHTRTLHTATLTHCSSCAAEFNSFGCGWRK